VRSIEFDKLPGFTGLAFHHAFIAEVDDTAVGFDYSSDVRG
jgi:hypothetical protein